MRYYHVCIILDSRLLTFNEGSFMTKEKILVVDNEEDILELINRSLRVKHQKRPQSLIYQWVKQP
jgi:hypothetical protein